MLRTGELSHIAGPILAVALALAATPALSQGAGPGAPPPIPPADVPFPQGMSQPPAGPLDATPPPVDPLPQQAMPTLPAPVTSAPLPGDANAYAPATKLPKPAAAAVLTPPAKGRLVMTAHLAEGGPAIKTGVVWRVFSEEPGSDGRREMVAEARGGTATFSLAPGAYYVYCGFGYAGTTDRVTVGTSLREESVVLNAGGVRLNAVATKNKMLPAADVSFDIYAPELDARGEPKAVALDIKPGQIVRLAANSYTVEADYGTANASTSAEIEVKAGKLSDITLTEKAAKVTLKLVNAAGGEAIADTTWSILTQAGDVVTSGVGAFPSFVLAEGDYTVIARHGGEQFQRLVTVRTGEDRDVEVLASAGQSVSE